jgi:ABC-type sugar transport system substrate-binding protein
MANKRLWTVLSVVTAAAMILTVVAPVSMAAPPAQEKKLTIALSLPDMAFPFFVFMNNQVQDEAKKIGNVDVVLLDAQNSSPKQTADMEVVIAKKYDGVLISPIDVEALAPGVQAVVDAGIPVVTIDRTVHNVNTLAHVGADNVRGGELQGELAMKLLPDGGKAFILDGQPGASPAIDRAKGAHNVLDQQDKIKIVAEQTGNFRRDDALTVTESMLAAEPKPDVIIAANDEMAFGAVEAVAGKGFSKGEVPIIGYDALPEALGFVKDGTMVGTVDQFPGQQSRVALQLLVNVLVNGVGRGPGQHDVWIIPDMITKDNLDKAERIGEVQQ